MSWRNTIRVVVASVLLAGAASPSMAGYLVGPAASNFNLLGTTWDPGANAASSFRSPRGPKSPGGATFSIMGSGLADASGFDTGHVGGTSDITALGISGYSAADYAADINAALDIWAAASGFTNLGQVGDGGVGAGAPDALGGHLGDIRVAAWEIASSNVLAHAYQPGTEAAFGAGGSIAGDTHFDVNRNWVNDASDLVGNGYFDFFTVALHELGHSLGLDHSNAAGSVMEAVYAGARRTLTRDDIKGIRALYGNSSDDGDGGDGGRPPWAGGPGGPNGNFHANPEPSSLVLCIFGAVCTLLYARRQRIVLG